MAMRHTSDFFFFSTVKRAHGQLTKARDSQWLAFPESNKLIQMIKACEQSCVAGAECPQIGIKKMLSSEAQTAGLHPQGKQLSALTSS